MEIRYANKKDIDDIWKIMKTVGRVAYTKDLVNDLISSKKSICLKLLEKNKIIGALGARAEGKNSYWLYFIVVKPLFRHKNYAIKLMNKLFKEVKKKGSNRIALDTPDEEFFKKFGFKEVGRMPKWYENKDQIIMFKQLTHKSL